MSSTLLRRFSPVLQFTTYFGVAMIALFWVAIEHNLHIRHDAAQRDANQNVIALSRIFEEHVSRALRETDRTLLLLRAAYYQNPQGFDLRKWVGETQFRTNLSVQYAFIGSAGFMIASNVGEVNATVDLSDREHFRVHKDTTSDSLFISKPVLGRVSGKWTVQLTRPMRDSNGRFDGVLVASIDPYHLSRLYESADLGRQGAITLVGLDGIIRARSGPDVLGKSMSSSEVFRHAQLSPSGIIEGAGVVDGVRRLVSYRTVDAYPMIVIAGMAIDEIFADYKGDAIRYRAAAGLLTALLAAFIFAGARSKYRLNATLAALAVERDSAQAANRAKSTFLAAMSHEIRTPMNAVLGLTTSLLEGPVTPDQKATLRTIYNSGDSLLEILNDILDFSQLEAGKLHFEVIPFDPEEIGASVASIIGPRAAAKGVALTISHAQDAPRLLKGDPGRLRQVLLNLVSNAVKFTAKGEVIITCRTIASDGVAATLEWSVADTGIGMSPDQIGKLFSDFSQADTSINRRFGGSGLGLSICKRIIDAMGGTIHVQSTLGHGTTMRVRLALPITEGQSAVRDTGEDVEARLGAWQSQNGRRLRVLVTDDNATNRLVACRMLATIDAQVESANDGTEAVAAAMARPFDVILMDMNMPEMDGLAAARAIRARGNQVPIVAFTANAFPDDIAACHMAGMNGFVPKPVRKRALLEAMLQAIEGEHNPIEATASLTADTGVLNVDWNVWAELEAELGPEGMSEAINAFWEECEGSVQEFSRLIARRADATRIAHTIKGTAATFGLLALSQIAGDIEANCVGFNPEVFKAKGRELATANHRARDEVNRRLDRMPSSQQSIAAPISTVSSPAARAALPKCLSSAQL